MLNEILLLSKIQLCNFFRLNESRYTKDPKKKNSMIITLCCLVLVVIAIGMSIWGNVLMLIEMGMQETVPAFISSTVAGMALMLSILRSGSILFNPRSYERTAPLPVKTVSVVISRLITLYVYNGFFTLLIGLFGAVAYAVHSDSSPLAVIEMFIGAILLPIVPMAVGSVIGTVAYKIASRAKKKNLMSSLLSIATVIVVCAISYAPSNLTTNSEIANAMAKTLGDIEKYYVISAWFTNGVNGDILSFLLFITVSVAVSVALTLVVCRVYANICIGMSSVSAKRSFKVNELKGRSIFSNLYFREIKRYFSSTVYTMNTLVGFILAIGIGIAFIAMDKESLEAQLGFPISVLARIIPVVIAAVCNTMPTTAASISLEGKHLWILQNLPIPMSELMKAKVCVNMTFAVPACLFASTCSVITFDQALPEEIFTYLIPLCLTLFGSFVGLYVNLLNPMMNWDNETQPVKQSKSALITMVVLFICEIIAGVILIMLPDTILTPGSLGVLVIFALATVFVSSQTTKFDLRKLD